MSKNKSLSIEEYRKVLKDSGLKITSTRLDVLEVFFKNDKPVTAFFICKKLNGKINEATVYRTLSSFEEKGILKRVDLRGDSVFFELNSDHHHHIVCTKCGSIEDFKENNDIEKLLRRVVEKSSKFNKIQEHSLELFGFCKMCNK